MTGLILLLAGCAIGTASGAIAQHKIDVETWIEMRKAMRPKGPPR